MMKIRKLALAATIAASFAASPALVSACQGPLQSSQAKPITTGPLMVQPANAATKWTGPFSEWVVDMNGVGLQICTDAADPLGNPPPCFFDPVDPATPYTQQLTRGGEAFWFLADNTFTTTGAFPITGVIVMGVESAFLSDPPAPGFETQFQRFRTRINVAAVGNYTVESPWGKKTYRVDTLLPAGSGQNRMEISEPIDIAFTPNSTEAGLVAPFLIADNRGSVDPALYIGDGLTPSTVTGSPCGDNFIRVTAVGLDGVTPIDINNGSNVFTSRQFTVQGKLAPTSAVPLAIGNAYYSRNAGATNVTVMAEGSTSASQLATATVEVNGQSIPMAKQDIHFYVTSATATPVALPQQITVRAEDPGRPSVPNTKTTLLHDFVTIDLAEARCNGSGATRLCTLTVNASSSDDGSAGAVTLTVLHSNTPLVNGAAAVSSAAIPAAVTVVSSAGGSATRNVTVVNQ